VTRSANDAAVVIAEAIAGDEDEFAKLMTRKARRAWHEQDHLSQRFRPAQRRPADHGARSGNARDARSRIASRAITATSRPPYSIIAASRSRNHNRLLGNVEGIDGIKTGYTRASGFNLVSSMRRGNRHLVGVVLGGRSGGSRDATMRTCWPKTSTRAPPSAPSPRSPNAAPPMAASMWPKPRPLRRKPFRPTAPAHPPNRRPLPRRPARLLRQSPL